MKKYKFTEKEQKILDYFEQDELLELPKKELESQKNIAKIAAANFFKKSERINIRLPLYDLNHIKRIAAQERMPYQTLIASVVVHKYASGYLKLDKLS
ncbi:MULTISPECIES: hypothetical protein [spotted fever group]|uniref:Antitoxin n=2 Tax=spotted fever group TaxID=114277 RepID=A0A0F3PIW8_RICRH|nr:MULTISPECIES: hypothetical protein [spotted fever group]AFB31842.1 hypothetical protein RMB_05405 [Rickettsia massiliae str. AZT80]KJV79134.1 hypothetical protein RMAECT_1176 [Rickettsia rhipicephali str. Ect]